MSHQGPQPRGGGRPQPVPRERRHALGTGHPPRGASRRADGPTHLVPWRIRLAMRVLTGVPAAAAAGVLKIEARLDLEPAGPLASLLITFVLMEAWYEKHMQTRLQRGIVPAKLGEAASRSGARRMPMKTHSRGDSRDPSCVGPRLLLKDPPGGGGGGDALEASPPSRAPCLCPATVP